MTSKELVELEWLASKLRSAADALQRAAALLQGSRDLERAEARLAAISGARGKTTAEGPLSHEADRKPVGGSLPVGQRRVDAVFDHTTRKQQLVGFATKEKRPPF